MNRSHLLALVISTFTTAAFAGTAVVPIEKPEPEYPPLERRWQRQGATLITYRIERDGSVGAAEVVGTSDWPSLDAAALESVRKYKFQPIDEPVTKTVRVRFKMKDELGGPDYYLNNLINVWTKLSIHMALQQATLNACGKIGVDLNGPLSEARAYDKEAIDNLPALELVVFSNPGDAEQREMFRTVQATRAERIITSEMNAANPQQYCATRAEHLKLLDQTSFTALYPAHAQLLKDLTKPAGI